MRDNVLLVSFLTGFQPFCYEFSCPGNGESEVLKPAPDACRNWGGVDLWLFCGNRSVLCGGSARDLKYKVNINALHHAMQMPSAPQEAEGVVLREKAVPRLFLSIGLAADGLD